MTLAFLLNSREGEKNQTTKANPPFLCFSPQTKGRTAVFGAACAAVVLIGGYIPVYAVQFQQRKASG
jgi:hypothetical protein|tara:strand:+ start:268 stop:468 length:201 start_codon:yes stop_codon:yes gene_type:complete